MTTAAHLAALVAILSTGVVYGTDVFRALVQRAALARVDDTTLTAVMGDIHRYADRRLPAPGILGVVAAAATTVPAAVAGHPARSATAGAALLLLIVWLLVYPRISAPINRRLTAAADARATPPGVRAWQHDRDRVIGPRAARQGLAVLALGVGLIA